MQLMRVGAYIVVIGFTCIGSENPVTLKIAQSPAQSTIIYWKEVKMKDLQQKPALRVGDVRQRFTYPKGCLTYSEWRELVALEYVLTWGYTDNEAEDSKRRRELSDKRWASLDVA